VAAVAPWRRPPRASSTHARRARRAHPARGERRDGGLARRISVLPRGRAGGRAPRRERGRDARVRWPTRGGGRAFARHSRARRSLGVGVAPRGVGVLGVDAPWPRRTPSERAPASERADSERASDRAASDRAGLDATARQTERSS
jgi:hypothetical protein